MAHQKKCFAALCFSLNQNFACQAGVCMTTDLLLPRKWTLRAHGQQVVFVKKQNERSAHVLMKAFLWALYLPSYPDLQVEKPIGDRYKPDVVMLDDQKRPLFWGEAGAVSEKKLNALARRFRHTHIAIAKWDTSLTPFATLVQRAVRQQKRTAPIDLLQFPGDSATRFIDAAGNLKLSFNDIQIRQFK